MIVQCDECKRLYDDTHYWTLCPHNPLGAGPKPGDFCKKHDMYVPCPCCDMEKQDEPNT